MMRLVLLLISFTAINAAEWNYADRGPEFWNIGDIWPLCALRRQSPVNIEIGNTGFSRDLEQNFDKDLLDYSANVTYNNNGHTVGMGFNGWTLPLGTANFTDAYKCVNLHLHWGTASSGGSEHTFNNEQTFAELHFVHFNTKYGTIGEAIDKSDGLAVLGVMVQKRGNIDNPAFEQLLTPIINGEVVYKDDAVDIAGFEFGDLFPLDLSEYYRYLGSLTTPACFESVTWTVFNRVIFISERQAEILSTSTFEYKLDAEENRVIENNFRPIQPLNGRRVYRSYLGSFGSAGSVVTTSISSIVLLVIAAILANVY